MRGRPPTPSNVKWLQGNPGHRRIPDEMPAPLLSEMPPPPSFLLPEAIAEWHRTGNDLIRAGTLSTLDLPSFAAYCQAWGRFCQAEQMLTQSGYIVSGSHGQPMAQPLIRIARAAAQQMIDVASQFGLTIAARSRIASVVARSPGKFDGLLSDGRNG
jgi:P27 family predicted phage terminase small subunit